MIKLLKAEIYGIKNIILNEINIMEYKSIGRLNRDDIYTKKINYKFYIQNKLMIDVFHNYSAFIFIIMISYIKSFF